MAVQARALKQKIQVVGNTRKITKTMQMVSVAKMKKTSYRAKSLQEYSKYVYRVIADIASQRDIQHPSFEVRENGKLLLTIIASDKGLCGGYNAQVEKQLKQILEEESVDSIDVIAVGKKAVEMARRNGLTIIKDCTAFSELVESGDVTQLAEEIYSLYVVDTDYKTASIIYTHFVSSITNKVKVQEMLPLKGELLTSKNTSKEEIFHPAILEPSAEIIMESVLPILVSTMLYHYILDSVAAEHSARTMAMQAATDNATELQQNLTREYNRARQAAVTQEVIEIINGAQALQ